MLQPKPHIEKLQVARHGGIDYAELEKLGIEPEDVLDFSVSTNPFGPPPGVYEALCRAPVDRYPDSGSTELKTLLSGKLNMKQENIIVGSGSTELIRLVATAYFGPGDTVMVLQPTYGEYEVASNIAGAEVLRQPVPEDAGFRLDVWGMLEAIRRHKPRGIFLCNPNNPTGEYLSREEIMALLTAAAGSLLILDEAYIAFTGDAWLSLDLIWSYNLVVLRSMTKDYALAGLRLGYAVAAEPVISVLERVKPPWNVSSGAQAAGIIALNDSGYLDECVSRISRAKEFLVEGLNRLGLPPLPSATNFFLVKVGDAAAFRRALLQKGILVRDCASFGLPQYIRLAPRSIGDCRVLLSAIKEVNRHDG